jgi:hypothetical protein
MVYSREGTALGEASLPSSDGYTSRYLLPVPPGANIWGYRVFTRAERGSLTLTGAGTAPRVHGLAFRNGALERDGSLTVRALTPGRTVLGFPSPTRAELARGLWVISLDLAPRDSGTGDGIGFRGEERAVTFLAAPIPARRRFDFTLGSIGFIPLALEVTSGSPETDGSPVSSCEIAFLPEGAPIPSDPGLILSYDRSLWRRKDFEVFSWTLFPHVLVFDTADYAVQDGMFKRLAFFVEKAGFAGTIPTSRELEGRHGYNAHDYQASDLGRFFTDARRKGIQLTEGELELLKVLISVGILRESGAVLESGEGAVLSISRSSAPPLRRLLLTHESFHGAFFSLSEFRDECARVWDSLSETERQVWRLFLSSRGYDVEDRGLTINEFQAYLFQQERRRVGDFQAVTLGRLRKSHPEAAGLLEAFLREHPDSFLRSFDLLDEALRAAGGPPGGSAIGVE